ncbi:MAG: phosphatidylglycerophosphatase A [Nitrospinota bacterium]
MPTWAAEGERGFGSRLALWLARGGGAGYVPFAPGTAGSAEGAVLAWLFLYLGPWGLLAGAAGVSALAVWATGRAERILGHKDPPELVLDEAAGMCWALVGAPARLGWWWLAAFLLFRGLDSLKPFRRLEAFSGGWGVVGDDVAAGLVTAGTLWLVRGAWGGEFAL